MIGSAGPTRPNATRTVAVDTPVCAAIVANVAPEAANSTTRALSASVSLIGPFGPLRVRSSPATPAAA